MAARSNGLFLPFAPAPPLPGQGHVVKVISCDDLIEWAAGLPVRPLATITQYTELVFSPEIGEVGAGSITIPLTAPLWQQPLSDGVDPTTLHTRNHLFAVFQDGLLLGEFIGLRVNESLLGSSEQAGMSITISGPGTAQYLDRAKVFSPYYPRATPKDKLGNYQFKDKPVMAAWLSLLMAAQRRGTANWVTPRFTATKDTGGQVWEDTYIKPPSNVGTALLAGDVLFPTDQFTLTAAGETAVKAISAKVAKITYPAVTVVGHADARGTKAYNYQLALDRANTVANRILQDHPFAVMTVISKGETQPVATNATAAGQAKNRRVRVTYQKASETGRHSTYEPPKGASLLKLLQELTGGQVTTDRSPIHVEWVMRPRCGLEIRRRIGRDRPSVVFHEGSTATIAKSRQRDRERIANLIAVQTDISGEYTVASDAVSRKRWQQHEFYQRVSGNLFTPAIRSKIASTQLTLLKDEDLTWTVQIEAGPGRRPFRDFNLGDTIGLVQFRRTQRSTVDRHRVMAISVRVGADGRPSYELRLESNRAGRLRHLQSMLDALITRQEGIAAYVADDQPTGARPGDLWTTPVIRAN